MDVSMMPRAQPNARPLQTCRRHTRLLPLLQPLILAVILMLVADAAAHQAFSYPIPMSQLNGCSNRYNCPGSPCPNTKMRWDVGKDAPSVTLRRGQAFSVRIRRNNHRWGFGRYSLVNVDNHMSHDAHAAGAFYYVCGDMNERSCQRWNSLLDCKFDRTNLYFEHRIRAPTHAPDGVYVLGWVWYGSRFSEFFDCTYVRIRGGRKTATYQPRFRAKHTLSGKRGKCLATTNDLGMCDNAQCVPGGKFKRLRQQVPKPFEGGKKPPRLLMSDMSPHIPSSRTATSVAVRSVKIVDASDPAHVLVRSTRTGIPIVQVCLKDIQATVLCDVVGGPVKFVRFLRHGGRYHKAQKEPPYAMEGVKENGDMNVLQFEYHNTYFTVGCYVKGHDGSEATKAIAVTTMFDDGSC